MFIFDFVVYAMSGLFVLMWIFLISVIVSIPLLFFLSVGRELFILIYAKFIAKGKL